MDGLEAGQPAALRGTRDLPAPGVPDGERRARRRPPLPLQSPLPERDADDERAARAPRPRLARQQRRAHRQVLRRRVARARPRASRRARRKSSPSSSSRSRRRFHRCAAGCRTCSESRQTPLLSFVCPTFNTREAYLSDLLGSFADERASYAELILSDDGSKDPATLAHLESRPRAAGRDGGPQPAERRHRGGDERRAARRARRLGRLHRPRRSLRLGRRGDDRAGHPGPSRGRLLLHGRGNRRRQAPAR